MKLKSIDRTRLSASIVWRIEEAIRAGGLQPGEPLPPERVLSDQLGVSRSSVREAIRVLEHAGVVEVRSGSGTYVAEGALSRGVMLRAQAAVVGEQSPLDLMVARRAIEPACAEQAALHRLSADIVLLRDRLARHKQAQEGDSVVALKEANIGFHAALVDASHNPILITLHGRLIKIMQESDWTVLRFSKGIHGTPEVERYVNDHSDILASVEAQDGAAAARAMHAHLDAVDEVIFSLPDDAKYPSRPPQRQGSSI
jgi:GntR family transcriptional repressor for pyruvate dehydrogenase complex